MRKYLFILILIFISASGFSQVDRPRNLPAFDHKPLHWGFTVGLNSMDFATSRTAANNFTYADVIGFQPSGFQVNIVSDLRLSDYWNLRVLPGINLGSRHMVFHTGADLSVPDTSMTIGSSFLDFPVVFKYRSERVNNYRPYVIAGLDFKYDMSARKEFDLEEDDLLLLKKADLYLELGFGVDNYLQYFKYSTEIKLAIGLRNMLLDKPYPGEEQYVESISHLRSFILMLNFHFE